MFSQLKRLPLASWPIVFCWAVLLGTLYAFVELAEEVYEPEGFFFDRAALTWLYARQSPLWTRLSLTLSFVGSMFVLGPVAVALVCGLWRWTRRAAVFLPLSLGGAVALNYGFKLLLARARPALFAQLNHYPSDILAGWALSSAWVLGVNPWYARAAR